ncbi:MAG: creatininase family protein [Burkholderiales bacterium]|nr:creatininase family protein [Burkholderiales bacterium]
MSDTIRYEELNTDSLKAGAYRRAIVPLGSCESHGGHLPFGTDAMIARDLALAVGERLPHTFVLPPTWFGMSEHYRHLPMAVSLSTDTATRLFSDIFRSLAHWGIEEVVVINGHDGNLPCLEIAARNSRQSHPDMRIAALATWWSTVTRLLPRETFGPGRGMGHGGEGETSLALALFPDLVDVTMGRRAIPQTDRHIVQYWTFDELTDCGSTGDPSTATIEKGRLMRDALVNCVIEFIERVERNGWCYRGSA